MKTKLIIDVLFNRSAIKPTIPNKLAKIKDYLAINTEHYYNYVMFTGGSKVDQQNTSVSRFEITINENTETIDNIFNQFLITFKGNKIYKH
jgi:hypothetical protein